uniref:BHLH domain-containing protein n=1 Tax=Rhabditophanes sp. KR3021 TaxID=114890 RepID=A0AC35TK74_9BILA
MLRQILSTDTVQHDSAFGQNNCHISNNHILPQNSIYGDCHNNSADFMTQYNTGTNNNNNALLIKQNMNKNVRNQDFSLLSNVQQNFMAVAAPYNYYNSTAISAASNYSYMDQGNAQRCDFNLDHNNDSFISTTFLSNDGQIMPAIDSPWQYNASATITAFDKTPLLYTNDSSLYSMTNKYYQSGMSLENNQVNHNLVTSSIDDINNIDGNGIVKSKQQTKSPKRGSKSIRSSLRSSQVFKNMIRGEILTLLNSGIKSKSSKNSPKISDFITHFRKHVKNFFKRRLSAIGVLVLGHQ